MLTGAGLRNDARLSHAFGKHGLTDGVIDFVRAGVVQVLAFEVDLRTTHFATYAGRMVNRRGSSYKMG